MESTRPRIERTPERLDTGYRLCRQWAQAHLRPWLWMVGNLPEQRRRGLFPLLFHSGRCMEMLGLESQNGLSLDVWAESRDDTNDAFRDEYTTIELMAIADTCRRFQVPRQYLFDQLDGADFWIRFRRFESFDELEVFAYRMGGAALASTVPVLGCVKPDYEVPAIRLGKAVFLTHVLANFFTDARAQSVFIARDDIAKTELDLERFKLRQSSKALGHLVGMYAQRIMNLLRQGCDLLDYLEFDAQRSVQSLIAVHWTMLTHLQDQPESLFEASRILSTKEIWALRLRHLMGTEGQIPLLKQRTEHSY